MRLGPFAQDIDTAEYSTIIESLLNRLYPICRSITGTGLRASLNILSEYLPLEIFEIPSGKKVFDWQVPDEWNIKDAYIKDLRGRKVVDFQKSNLHVVGYSAPIKKRIKLVDLKPHLHTLPHQPKAIPYLTSYYEKNWGFCMTHEQYLTMVDDEYDICIESSLEPGSVTIGEVVLPGETEKEFLLSTYCCHPSMANNELSGPIIVSLIYKYLASLKSRRYTYRFYCGTETIGTLAYLSLRGEHLKNKMVAGLVVTCCGDRGMFNYKKARNADNILDKTIVHSLLYSDIPYKIVPFFPTGSDERQYSSPGFNLPVGSLMRSMYGTYPEYHTSLDNLDFVSVQSLLETLRVYLNCLYTFEKTTYFRNLKPFGEPCLSKYGLYETLGGNKNQNPLTRKMLFILNYSDGKHDLVEIANMLELPVWECEEAVSALKGTGLLENEL